MRTYSGHSTAAASNELYRTNLAQGADRPVGRVRPPDPDRLRPRPRRSPGARSARSACRCRTSATCATLFDGIPLDEMNTSMTINATAMWLLGLYVAHADEHGVDVRAARGHDAERHREGVPVARHVHLPARAVAAADRRHDRVHGAARARSGTRSTCARTTCRRRARRRCRSSRTRSPTAIGVLDAVRDSGQVADDEFPEVVGRISFFVERRHPLRRGDVQDARVHPAVGPHLPRALRRHRREAAPVPLRRAGELARPHRGAAREQRAAHRARDARRHAVEGRAGARDPAARAGTRRSACPDAVGPAVVAADPAGARARDRPARVRRPLRRLERRRGARPPSWSRRPRPSSSGCSTAAARSR